jgi:hypothetical protein
LTQALTADTSGSDLLKIAIGGLVSGMLTPLAPVLVDKLTGAPGMFRLALVAMPFAVLVFIVVRRCSANPVWAALVAVIVTMIAFVCAVNAAVFIDGQADGASKMMRNILAGLSGGLVGTAVMALGIALLPAGPRKAAAWWPMLMTGAVFGPLLALDSALGLDQTSVLYPLWQAAIVLRLALVLRSRPA